MTLDIKQNEQDLPIIKRIKNSLLNKYNPNKEKDIESVVELANYLVALQEYEQAKKLLESSIYLDPSHRSEDLWVTNAQGIVLLVYIARITGQSDLYKKYIQILVEHDMWPIDIGRTKWVKMHIYDHKKKVDYALTETQKYKCGIIGQEVLSFMYFYEILFIYERPKFLTKIMLKDVEEILTNSQELLREALES